MFTFKELIRDGDFRLTKAVETDNGPRRYIVVQHRCGSEDVPPFSGDGWVFCWESRHGDINAPNCAGCKTKVPPEMSGFLNMVTWKR